MEHSYSLLSRARNVNRVVGVLRPEVGESSRDYQFRGQTGPGTPSAYA